jgi:hypothetical protein
MNKQTIIIGLLSLTTVTLPAFIFAICLASIFGHFWAWFCLLFGVSFVIGQLSNTYLSKKLNSDLLKIQTRLAEVTNQQNVEVSCAYCKARNIVPIFLAQRNTFECKNCRQHNLIIFQFTTAQITVPLELPQLADHTKV